MMALINGTKNILFSYTKKSFTDILNDTPNQAEGKKVALFLLFFVYSQGILSFHTIKEEHAKELRKYHIQKK